MAKVNLEKFKSNAKSALSKKETHGIFKEQREKIETIPLNALENGIVIRLFERDLGALEKSIETVGQLEPIVVRRRGERYEVLNGNRRVEVAKALGFADIAAEVVDVDEQDALFLPYLLNAPESFDLIEIALYLQRLKQEHGIDDDTIAEKSGLKVADYKELFFDNSKGDPLTSFNEHFEALLKRYFRIIRDELDIEKGGVRLKIKVDKRAADDKTKAEVYRFIYKLSQM
ncbi:ParB N-terminal domain-containing protein [Hydrogenimonas sp.]|uniref:ParB/RepB/Spo0J family partition protein n=1 Tax=Hydrogenimonas sp. TaxID=2231112 RepID=UPI002607174D|nr:ParB N-terminal domain-containing protein [Hydrogenimonas sp.]